MPLTAQVANQWQQMTRRVTLGQRAQVKCPTSFRTQYNRHNDSGPLQEPTPERLSCPGGAATYPLVVIHNAAPVQHVHHCLEAEDGLLVELVVTRHCEGSGRHHDRLVGLYPCKLLLPYLYTTTVRGNCQSPQPKAIYMQGLHLGLTGWWQSFGVKVICHDAS